jgi:hypothetical protein
MGAGRHPGKNPIGFAGLLSHHDRKSANPDISPRRARGYRHLMAKRDPRMIPLGYGKFVRADRIYALVPLEGAERQDGRRTYVHVDGLDQPIVASRSERAILADVETALAEAAGLPRRRRSGAPGQESLL